MHQPDNKFRKAGALVMNLLQKVEWPFVPLQQIRLHRVIVAGDLRKGDRCSQECSRAAF